ncbi:MAG: hypothetical protein ACFCBV_14045 [Phycisphaerales bacterium]
MPRLCQCTVLTAALAIAACPAAATAANQDELPQDEIEAVEPAAELPEAIRNLLLGVGTPSRGGEGMLAVEGSILPERAGLIRRTPYGEWAFVFVRDDGQPAAMVLLPCRQLERMVESVQATNATAIRLTGRLTVYENVNYVLPTNYSIISTETASSDGDDESQPATDPLNQIDPMLREVAEQLEAGRIRARSLQAPPMAPPSIREPRARLRRTRSKRSKRTRCKRVTMCSAAAHAWSASAGCGRCDSTIAIRRPVRLRRRPRSSCYQTPRCALWSSPFAGMATRSRLR